MINIPGRPAELSNASLKSLKAFCYSKKGDWESSFELIKSAFLDSGGGDDKINNELINISFSLYSTTQDVCLLSLYYFLQQYIF